MKAFGFQYRSGAIARRIPFKPDSGQCTRDAAEMLVHDPPFKKNTFSLWAGAASSPTILT